MTTTDLNNNLLDDGQVKKAVNAIFQYKDKQQRKDAFLNEGEDIQMQMTFKLIPDVKNKIIKIPLPTALTRDSSSVCLFVKDLDKKSRDTDASADHFKDLLSAKGVSNIAEVIPLKMLKLEYQPYEAKRNLSNMYDFYLADERIVRLLPALLGKSFYGKKRHPVSIDLQVVDLQHEIERALSGTRLIISGRGSSTQVVVAHTMMTQDQVVQNVMAAAKRVAELLPGGAANIKNIHLRMQDSPALPVYVSEGANENIVLPERKRKLEDDEPEEISTLMDKKVKVSATGDITFYSMEGECLTKTKSTKRPRLPSAKGRAQVKKTKAAQPKATEATAKTKTLKAKTVEQKESVTVKKTSSKVMRLAQKDTPSKAATSKQQKQKKNMQVKSLQKKGAVGVKSKPKSKKLKS